MASKAIVGLPWGLSVVRDFLKEPNISGRLANTEDREETKKWSQKSSFGMARAYDSVLG